MPQALISTYDNTNSLHINAYDEAIAERGGVLAAMETGYQRGKIQEESLDYEHRKHNGFYPIIGVNTFRNPHGEAVAQEIVLIRPTEAAKQSQLKRLGDFQKHHAKHRGGKDPRPVPQKHVVVQDRNRWV
jgi:isobutyryl-CoA mutase